MTNTYKTIQVLLWSMISVAIPTIFAQTTVFKEGIFSVNVTRGDGERANTTDEFHLATFNRTLCNDTAKLRTELGADCMPKRGQSRLGWCELTCRCSLQGKPSFILNEKQCVDDRKFRAGCYFVLGSWTWSTGWTWDSQQQPLQTFYAGSGFGLTSGFNASISTFSDCAKTSMAFYNAAGEWKPVAVEQTVIFFKVHRMWHLSWISTGETGEIEGKFVKLEITCTNTNSVNGSNLEHTSCVVVKVTGNLEHKYNVTTIETSSNPTEQTSTPTVLTRISTIPITDPTGQTNSGTIQTNGPTVQTTNGPTVQTTNGPTVQTTNGPITVQTTNGPTVQTTNGPITVQTTNGPITVQTTNGPITVQTTNGPTVQTTNGPTVNTSKENYDEKPQIGLIVLVVVGSSALLIILIAAVVFIACYYVKSANTNNARERSIPMMCQRATVNAVEVV